MPYNDSFIVWQINMKMIYVSHVQIVEQNLKTNLSDDLRIKKCPKELDFF